MRRVKANVFLDRKGSIVFAQPPGARVEGHERYDQKSGYIEIPVSKANSRRKGNDLEITAAKIFSSLLYGRDDVLKRTPLSGGWGSAKLGDITPDPALCRELKIPSTPNVYVECKNYASISEKDLLDWLVGEGPKIIKDWIESCDKAIAPNQKWFLVIKPHRGEPWVITGNEGMSGVFVRGWRGGLILYPLKFLLEQYSPEYLAILRGS